MVDFNLAMEPLVREAFAAGLSKESRRMAKALAAVAEDDQTFRDCLNLGVAISAIALRDRYNGRPNDEQLTDLARWFVEARRLTENLGQRFRDEESGGFFDTASDHEALIVRPRSFEDHPIPSGSSSAAYALLQLNAFTGDRAFERPAVEVFGVLHRAAARHPQAFGHLLQALHFYFSRAREVALVGDRLDPLAQIVRRRYRPTVVIAGMRPGDEEATDAIPLLRGREPVDGRAAAYVCENFTCRLPVTEPEELERALESA